MIASLTKRHLQVFFRDKGAVFFSLLSPLIMFLVFFLFLSSTQLTNLEENLPNTEKSTLSIFLNSWVYAGIIMTTSVTTGLAALGIFVSDRETGRFTDFAVSPISRWKVVVSYLLATVIIATIITTSVYVVAQIHLSVQGAEIPTLETVVQIIGRYLLVAFSFGAISSLVVTFIKTNAAFTALSVFIGAGIGFFAGIYVPIGLLSANVSNFLNSLPYAQATALIREPFVTIPLERIGDSEPTQAIEGVSTAYGLEAVVDGHVISISSIVLILVVIGILALILATMQISRKLK